MENLNPVLLSLVITLASVGAFYHYVNYKRRKKFLKKCASCAIQKTSQRLPYHKETLNTIVAAQSYKTDRHPENAEAHIKARIAQELANDIVQHISVKVAVDKTVEVRARVMFKVINEL